MRIADENLDIKFNYDEKRYSVFSEDTQNFIKAMCYMAKVNPENLDRHIINSKINLVQEYIGNCQSANKTVNNMFGFKEKIGEMEYKTKEYYFFIADIKIKSVVYLLRIDSFLEKWEASHSINERKKIILNDIENMKIRDVRMFFGIFKEMEHDAMTFVDYKPTLIDKNVQGRSDNTERTFHRFNNAIMNFLSTQSKAHCLALSKLYKLQRDKLIIRFIEKDEETEKENDSRSEDYLTQIKGIVSLDNISEIFIDSDNVQDIKNIEYYLFDNSMNEIDFCGVEWDWLWRYECDKADLFRCVGTDSFGYEGHYSGYNRREYYQNMIRNIVFHMNKGNKNKLASYSKNPFRDIFKYMISKYQDDRRVEYSFLVKNESNASKAVLKELNSENIAIKPIIFALVKKAETNVIKKMYKSHLNQKDFSIGGQHYKCVKADYDSFSDFVLGEDNDEDYNFCVDIFNTRETYSGDIRRVFGIYTQKFPNVEVPRHQLSIVAVSDHEVVMLGNTCDKIVRLNDFNLKSRALAEKNVEYRVELNRNEILCLFYRMHLLCNKNKANFTLKLKYTNGEYFCNEIPVCFEDDTTFSFVKEVKCNLISGNTEENINDIKALVEKKEYDSLELAMSIRRVIQGENEGKTVEKIEKVVSSFENNIKTLIKECMINQVDVPSPKIDFIISFLSESEFKDYPQYGTTTYKNGDEDKLVALFRKILLK